MKEQTYKKEEMFLSPFAKKSNATLGRQRPEEPCPMRTEFQRDRDRIIYSKAFIRLKNKTQVFFSPEGDHYVTRLTHTLDVAQIARSIARELSLNEDLAEAIALGHDLGHTPFGHAGERCLQKLNPSGFAHNEQSLRVVDVIEDLNLTQEVRDGILNHKISLTPSTLEGQAVRIADKIAYLNHDIDDAVRAGIIKIEDLPSSATKLLGDKSSGRINKMITSIVTNSLDKPYVDMQKDVWDATLEIRTFMNDKVYRNDYSAIEEEKAFNMIKSLYLYLKERPNLLPETYTKLLDSSGIDQVICDYISCMTDRYCTRIFEEYFMPNNFLLKTKN